MAGGGGASKGTLAVAPDAKRQMAVPVACGEVAADALAPAPANASAPAGAPADAPAPAPGQATPPVPLAVSKKADTFLLLRELDGSRTSITAALERVQLALKKCDDPDAILTILVDASSLFHVFISSFQGNDVEVLVHAVETPEDLAARREGTMVLLFGEKSILRRFLLLIPPDLQPRCKVAFFFRGAGK
jgi:hypothetical protein